jgi:hypothetical protein
MYDYSRCTKDASTGAAACQAMISPKDVAEAVIASLPAREVADAS